MINDASCQAIRLTEIQFPTVLKFTMQLSSAAGERNTEAPNYRMMNLENCINVNAPGFEILEDQKLKARVV